MKKIGINQNNIKDSFLTKVFGLLFFLFALCGSLSAQTLSGVVYTIDEKGDTVTVYMARLQWLNTTVGTFSNTNGTYKLPFANTDTLLVSYSFYKTDTVIIDRKTRRANIFYSTAQQLKEVVVSKRKKKYKRKGNPAVELVQNVIANKYKNHIDATDCYKSKVYKKMVTTFGKFDMDFQKNGFNRQLAFLEKYIDTLQEDTLPVLTISLREELSDYYYQKSPSKRIKYIIAKRMQGVAEPLDEEGLGANLNAMFTEVNIFDNDIDLMLNKFVSPLSSTLATTFYHYYITDTTEIDGIKCVELTFTPANNRGFGFSGRMYIVNDSTYALKKYAFNVPVNINMNFVRHLLVEQDFAMTESGLWAPHSARTSASFSLIKRKKMRRLFMYQTTKWYDYELGNAIPDSLSGLLSGETIEANDVSKYKSGRWSKMRPVPLSAKESFIDSLGPELRRLPTYKVLEKGAEILGSSYIATAKDRKSSCFDIGSVYNMISHNPTEGLRLRVGGTTTAKLHKRWFVNSYIAFGCKDLRIKYNITLIHSFVEKNRYINEFPRRAIYLTTSYDMELPGQKYTYLDRDNIFLSYNVGVPELSAQYVRRFKLRYEHEWKNRLSIDTWLQYEDNEATGSLVYWRINGDGTASRVNSFSNIEWYLCLRWAPGQRTSNSRTGKETFLKLSKNAPVISISHTIGLMDRRFFYNKTDFSIDKRFWLSAFGYIDATVQAGIVWNKVPFPKLYVPQSNQSLFMTQNTFCMMAPMEFIMDKYVSWFATYHLKGLIFNRIPLWNRLRLREVVSFSGIYGSISSKNVPNVSNSGLFVMPEACSAMGKIPYMEITAGIENILQIIRIDYVRRLTYSKELKGWAKNGVRVTFTVTF